MVLSVRLTKDLQKAAPYGTQALFNSLGERDGMRTFLTCDDARDFFYEYEEEDAPEESDATPSHR